MAGVVFAWSCRYESEKHSEKSNIVGQRAYNQTMEDWIENKCKEVVRDV